VSALLFAGHSRELLQLFLCRVIDATAAAVNGEQTVNIFILVKPSKTRGASSVDSNTSAFSREAAVSTVRTSGILQLPAVY
jgi:hypothetical protein